VGKKRFVARVRLKTAKSSQLRHVTVRKQSTKRGATLDVSTWRAAVITAAIVWPWGKDGPSRAALTIAVTRCACSWR